VTPIAIPDELLAAIYAHAIAAFPDECCGYLVGAAPDAVDAVVPCRNAQAGGPAIAIERGADTSFAIAGDELWRFARSFDGDRPARIVYHSHTNGRAYFSSLDREMAAGPAYPVQHVVVGVARGAERDGGGRGDSGDGGGRGGERSGDGGAVAHVTEVAQFAWSAAARDHVEVARWSPASRTVAPDPTTAGAPP
jgi:[CysO sulfur-carrier protein]-S-L-cysteine hydrolase